MELPSRIKSAEDQSFELHNVFSKLEHRTREFMEVQKLLTELHASTAALQHELATVKSDINAIQAALPSLARKEELSRFKEKIEAMPFETMIKRKDL